MRQSLLLLALCLVLSFLAGFLRTTAPEPPAADREELDALLLRFSREEAAECLVSPNALLARGGGAALLDPVSMLPASSALPADELRLFAASVASGIPPPTPLKDAMLDKALAWHMFLASPDRALDPGFFARSPQIHPGGGSYVRLARRSGRAEFRSGKWLADHLDSAHAKELSELVAAQPGFVLDPPRAVLAALGNGALQALHDRDPVVMDERYLLLARAREREGELAGEGGRDGESEGERARNAERAGGVEVGGEHAVWAVHPRAAWDRFLAATPYRLVPHFPRTPAIVRRGRLDWQIDLPRVRARAARLQALTLGGLVTLALGVAALLWMRISARDEEARRRRFMLQTLAHELRTPLTSMSLALESLRDRFDELPPPAQDALGRLLDDAARLERVVGTSRHYLRESTSTRLLDLTPTVVPSVNEWVADLVAEVGATPLDGLPADAAATLDLHWTGVCIRNLAENALRHGRPPVRVTLARDGDALVVTVSDQGACAFADLDAMALPFVRGPASSGTGLGLAIVRSIALELGGTLAFHPQPTRFVLRLPGVLG